MSQAIHPVSVFVRVRSHKGARERTRTLSVRSSADGATDSRSEVVLDSRSFVFDQAGDEGTSQARVFDVVGRPTLDAFLGGYNGTILCYGQSGSGKTYTMTGGKQDDRGLLPRLLEEALGELARRQQAEFDAEASTADAGATFYCSCSFLQIHNDQITDLLAPASASLRLREAPDARGTFVDGLKQVQLRSAAEALRTLALGTRRRTVASTLLNDHSSRSHAVFILRLQRVTRASDGLQVRTSQLNLVDLGLQVRTSQLNLVDLVLQVRTSQLNLVDLAGSERQARVTQSSSELGMPACAEDESLLLDEACSINRSLSALSGVIQVGDLARGVWHRDDCLSNRLDLRTIAYLRSRWTLSDSERVRE
jgi:hypothetical protein